ncbi:cysteine-rich secretory protein family domain-containing protein [Phthorimaea operculella]|nr:cysteine-rich secretory protein family domain-containing protein [Phthorimaea operculella]
MVFSQLCSVIFTCYLVLCTKMAAVKSETESSSTASDFDPQYCALRYRRLCQGKGQHIACQFPDPGPGDSCVNYTMIKFTKELQHFVTHYINRRRQRIALGNERVRGGVHVPRPEVMMLVEWDKELALLAQRLADQCSFVHDDCRATVRFPYAGQTVGEIKWHRTSDSDKHTVARAIRRVLDAWWGERRRVTARQLIQPFRLTNRGNVWGHFSQLAVWTLRAVGCGAAKHGVNQPKLLLVCDFSHTNMLGQRTLVPGPLGPCPIHTARRPRSPYPTLCAPVRYQDEEEDQTPSNHNAIAHEMHYKDEHHENYDHYDHVDNTDEIDDVTSYNNATLARKPTELEKPKEMQKPKDIRITTVKRQRVNSWREAYEEESGSNEIFRHDDVIKNRDKIQDKIITREYQTERIRYINKHKDTNKKVERLRNNLVTAIHAVDATSASDIDGISDDENTEFYSVNRYRDFVRGYHRNQERFEDNATMVDTRIRDNMDHLQEYPNNYRKTDFTAFKQQPRKNSGLGQNGFRLSFLREQAALHNQEEGTRAQAVSGAPESFYEPVGVRHRWRPTTEREKPQRPGARVLKTNTYTDFTTTRLPAAKKNSIKFASILMDKDDVEQLFKDTGFNFAWRRYRKIGG